MAQGGKEQKNDSSDLMDKDISFENRDMHKTWPMVKGCLTLIGAVIVFIFISMYVFKTFGSFFG